MAARFYPGCHTDFQILIDMRAKVLLKASRHNTGRRVSSLDL
jgi:hypothetical protein